MEHLYAVLTNRFHIAIHPAWHPTVLDLIAVAKTVSILHNMTTELRRDGFLSRVPGAGAQVAMESDSVLSTSAESRSDESDGSDDGLDNGSDGMDDMECSDG